MCIIKEDSVQRVFIPGNELPRFWEGLEVVGSGSTSQPRPTAVAA